MIWNQTMVETERPEALVSSQENLVGLVEMVENLVENGRLRKVDIWAYSQSPRLQRGPRHQPSSIWTNFFLAPELPAPLFHQHMLLNNLSPGHILLACYKKIFKTFLWKEDGKNIYHLLVHIPKGCNSWGLPKVNPEAWDSIWSPTWVAGTDVFESVPATFQGAHQQALDLKQSSWNSD